jgi:histidinol phosphatase-like PHP family hydrolase
MAGRPEKKSQKRRNDVLKMKKPIIMNTEKEDYHVHSFNYSDSMATVDEIARFAGELGLKKIVITDHSQAALEREGYTKKSGRGLIREKRWENVHNDVEISFGVEADLLNEEGDICADIQGIQVQGEFVILSYHKNVYKGDKERLTEAFINAIHRHKDMIKSIGHLFVGCDKIDILKVVEAANQHNIPLELNCRYLVSGRTSVDMSALKLILSKADSIYVNSDAHTLWELKELRKLGFKFLEENGFLKEDKN